MQITIVQVGKPETVPTDKGGSYQKLEVLYRGEDGEVKTKKLVSFKNPGAFKELKNAASGAVYDVKDVKNSATGYWDWVSVSKSDGEAVVETTPATNQTAETVTKVEVKPITGKVTGSNYETPQERAARQVWIVRQSSLGHAVEILKNNATPFTVGDVFTVAKELERWVFRSENPFIATGDIKAAETVDVPLPKRGRPKAATTVVKDVQPTVVE